MYISETFGLFSVPMSKASFCITLLHLTMVPWQRRTLCFIFITINVSFWAGAILILVRCEPKERLWDITLEGKCWDNRIVMFFSMFIGGMNHRTAFLLRILLTCSAYSTLIDLLLALCPWVVIRKLQMPKFAKPHIVAAMSLGCLSVSLAIHQ